MSEPLWPIMRKLSSVTSCTRVRLMLLAWAIVAVVSVAGAQQSAIPPAVQAATLGQTVPVDPLITVGTLPNGLRYYVRENRQPQARAELRLVVNAGSVLEDEDQRGLAHFVEHMSFNGDRKSTRLNSSHGYISYAVFCLKKKKKVNNSTSGYLCEECTGVRCPQTLGLC